MQGMLLVAPTAYMRRFSLPIMPFIIDSDLERLPNVWEQWYGFNINQSWSEVFVIATREITSFQFWFWVVLGLYCCFYLGGHDSSSDLLLLYRRVEWDSILIMHNGGRKSPHKCCSGIVPLKLNLSQMSGTVMRVPTLRALLHRVGQTESKAAVRARTWRKR